MNFSESVKKVMEKLGKNKADLARDTGYSYQHIHDLLAGERRWNEDSINKTCAALGITISVSEAQENTKEGESDQTNVVNRPEHHHSRDQQLQADCGTSSI